MNKQLIINKLKVIYRLRISLIIFILLGNAAHLNAEVTFDRSIGTHSDPSYIPGIGNVIILLPLNLSGNMVIEQRRGASAGNNIFHSFSTLNVNAGETLAFEGLTTTENIISRVTGVSASNVNGLISTVGTDNAGAGINANLWLMNPSGFVFGNGASIDVLGSFYATTSDYIGFSDSSRFNADIQASSNLTVASPDKFGFVSNLTSAISFTGSNLSTPNIADLNFIGRSSSTSADAIQANNSTISVTPANVNFAGVLGAGEINIAGNTLSTAQINGAALDGNISINNSSITISSNGQLFIRGGDFVVSNSTIEVTAEHMTIDTDSTDIVSNSFINSMYSPITINTDKFSMSSSTIKALGFEQSHISISGRSPNTRVSNFTMVNNSIIDTTNQFDNNGTLIGFYAGGSDITINADTVNLDDSHLISYVRDPITSPDYDFGVGFLSDNRAGTIAINAGTIDILNGSVVDVRERHTFTGTPTFYGAAGSINFSATDILINNSYLYATSVVNGLGEMHLTATNNLDVLNGSRLRAGTRSFPLATGAGSVADAGILEFNAAQMTISASTIESSSLFAGDSGNIEISGGSLTLKDGADIRVSRSSGVYGLTSAGNIVINLSGDLNIGTAADTVTNSRIESEALDGIGSAGNISITANNVSLKKEAEISVLTTSNTPAPDAADAKISIKATNQFSLIDENSIVSSSTSGSVDAGEIVINASDIQVNAGTVEASTTAAGNAGSIILNDQRQGNTNTIDLLNMSLRNGGRIGTSTTSSGNAGSILINANETVTVGNNADTGVVSIIESKSTGANSGAAGTVEIQANNITLNNLYKIQVSTESNNTNNTLANINLTASNTFTVDSTSANTAQIEAYTLGDSDAGDVNIVATTIDMSQAVINTETMAGGQGGNINLTADDINILSNSVFFSQANASTGNAGDIIIRANDTLSINGLQALSRTTATANAGKINLYANNMNLTGSLLETNSWGLGNAGNIQLIAVQDVDIKSGQINSSTGGHMNTSASGNVGSIDITGRNVTISERAIVETNTLTTATGVTPGAINITATENLVIKGVPVTGPDSPVTNTEILAGSLGGSNAGQITLTAKNMQIASGAIVDTSTGSIGFGGGDAGSIDINVTESIELNNATISSQSLNTFDPKVEHSTVGDAGKININTASLSIINGGQILTDTVSVNGVPASINITAGTVDINGTGNRPNNDSWITGLMDEYQSGVYSRTYGSTGAGAITFDVTTLNNSGIISATTFGNGAGGMLTVNATDVNITGGGRVSTSTSGAGNAGSVTVIATNNIVIGTASDVTSGSTVESQSTGVASGSAGSITITAQQINMSGDGKISALTESTDTTNNIANVSLTATNSLNLQSGTSISTNTTGNVNAGSISLNTVLLNNSGVISASTSGNGDAGIISLTGGTANINSGTVSSSTSSTGQGGSIITSLAYLNLTNGGQFLTNTSGSGAGGGIDITATDTVLIRGKDVDGINASGLRSESLSGSGTGGTITVNAPTIRIDQNGITSTVSTGSGDAGNINLLAANNLYLNKAAITTNSQNASGGSIKLYAPNYILIDESEITAEASGVTPGNDGGNISIDPILLSINQSSIIANANAGNGGNINIVADNLLISADTNVDASSNTGLDGDISVESLNQYLGTDAKQETPYLDISRLINNRCVAAQRQRSSFTTEERSYLHFTPDKYLPSSIDNVIKKRKYQKQAMLDF